MRSLTVVQVIYVLLVSAIVGGYWSPLVGTIVGFIATFVFALTNTSEGESEQEEE